jgi:hypothetical protein
MRRMATLLTSLVCCARRLTAVFPTVGEPFGRRRNFRQVVRYRFDAFSLFVDFAYSLEEYSEYKLFKALRSTYLHVWSFYRTAELSMRSRLGASSLFVDFALFS